ncbi:MAG: hypothetical protein K6D97_04255 [Clostridia bacterium]|nr:hypothetical protein [Clostridia bacterium]
MIPEIFRFRRELNIKKILFFAIITIITLVIIICIVHNIMQFVNMTQTGKTTPSKIYYDKDKSVSIVLDKDLNKKYKFKQYNSINDYLIELRSENNIGVFISRKEKLEDKDFAQVVQADCQEYVNQFTNYTNASLPQEFQTNISPNAYTYSLQYLEKQTKTPYYLQVTWIEMDDYYYIIDTEMPYSILQETPEEASNVLTDILSNINIIK